MTIKAPLHGITYTPQYSHRIIQLRSKDDIMGMTSKHYEMIADTMAESLVNAQAEERPTLDIILSITALSSAFKIENPRFNEDRFQKRVNDMVNLLSSINADNYSVEQISQWLWRETGFAPYQLKLEHFTPGSPVYNYLSRLRQIEERQAERMIELEHMRSTWHK